MVVVVVVMFFSVRGGGGCEEGPNGRNDIYRWCGMTRIGGHKNSRCSIPEAT